MQPINKEETIFTFPHYSRRAPGYYWIVLRGKPVLGQWGSTSVYGNVWTVHNDPHEYGDLELDAIVPFPIYMDAAQAMYARQLSQDKDKQMEYLWVEWEVPSTVRVPKREMDDLISQIKSLRDGI